MQVGKPQLINKIKSDIADNSTGQISPRDVRTNLIDIIDSVHLFTGDKDLNALNFATPDTRTTKAGSKTLSKLHLQNYQSVDNSAFGYSALSENYNGERNTAIGSHALSCNLYGSGNTAVGFNSIAGNIFGSGNVGVGNFALQTNKHGSFNIAIGHGAGYYVGNNSSYQFYLGSHDIAGNPACDNPEGSGLTPLLRGDLKNLRLGVGTNELHSHGSLQVAGNVTPSGDCTSDLGHSSYRWNNLYLCDSINDIASFSGGHVSIGSHMVPKITDTYDLGRQDRKWNTGYFQNIRVSGTADINNYTYKEIESCLYECRTLYLATSGNVCDSGSGPCGFLNDEQIEYGGMVLQSSGADYRRDYEFTYKAPDSTLKCLESDSPYSRSSWNSNISLHLAEGNHLLTDRLLGRDNLSMLSQNCCYGLFIQKDTEGIRQGKSGVDEKQLVSVDATGGTFTLTFLGQTTSAISYNAYPETIEAQLQALSTIGAGNVRVFGGYANANGIRYWEIRFTGDLKEKPLAQITSNCSGLTKTTASRTITRVVTPGQNHKIKIITNCDGGSWYIHDEILYAPQVLPPGGEPPAAGGRSLDINCGASNLDIKDAIVGGFNGRYGTDDIEVTTPSDAFSLPDGQYHYLVEFKNNAGNQDQGNLVLSDNLLTGSDICYVPAQYNEIQDIKAAATGGTFVIKSVWRERAAVWGTSLCGNDKGSLATGGILSTLPNTGESPNKYTVVSTTGDISIDATAADVKNAIINGTSVVTGTGDIASISTSRFYFTREWCSGATRSLKLYEAKSNNFTVSKLGDQGWRIEFTGVDGDSDNDMRGVDLNLLFVDGEKLTAGGQATRNPAYYMVRNHRALRGYSHIDIGGFYSFTRNLDGEPMWPTQYEDLGFSIVFNIRDTYDQKDIRIQTDQVSLSSTYGEIIEALNDAIKRTLGDNKCFFFPYKGIGVLRRDFLFGENTGIADRHQWGGHEWGTNYLRHEIGVTDKELNYQYPINCYNSGYDINTKFFESPWYRTTLDTRTSSKRYGIRLTGDINLSGYDDTIVRERMRLYLSSGWSWNCDSDVGNFPDMYGSSAPNEEYDHEMWEPRYQIRSNNMNVIPAPGMYRTHKEFLYQTTDLKRGSTAGFAENEVQPRLSMWTLGLRKDSYQDQDKSLWMVTALDGDVGGLGGQLPVVGHMRHVNHGEREAETMWVGNFLHGSSKYINKGDHQNAEASSCGPWDYIPTETAPGEFSKHDFGLSPNGYNYDVKPRHGKTWNLALDAYAELRPWNTWNWSYAFEAPHRDEDVALDYDDSLHTDEDYPNVAHQRACGIDDKFLLCIGKPLPDSSPEEYFSLHKLWKKTQPFINARCDLSDYPVYGRVGQLEDYGGTDVSYDKSRLIVDLDYTPIVIDQLWTVSEVQDKIDEIWGSGKIKVHRATSCPTERDLGLTTSEQELRLVPGDTVNPSERAALTNGHLNVYKAFDQHVFTVDKDGNRFDSSILYGGMIFEITDATWHDKIITSASLSTYDQAAYGTGSPGSYAQRTPGAGDQMWAEEAGLHTTLDWPIAKRSHSDEGIIPMSMDWCRREDATKVMTPSTLRDSDVQSAFGDGIFYKYNHLKSWPQANFASVATGLGTNYHYIATNWCHSWSWTHSSNGQHNIVRDEHAYGGDVGFGHTLTTQIWTKKADSEHTTPASVVVEVVQEGQGKNAEDVTVCDNGEVQLVQRGKNEVTETRIIPGVTGTPACSVSTIENGASNLVEAGCANVLYFTEESNIQPNPLTEDGKLTNITDVNFIASSGDSNYAVTYAGLESNMTVGHHLVSQTARSPKEETNGQENIVGFHVDYKDENRRQDRNEQEKDRMYISAYDDTIVSRGALTLMRNPSKGFVGINDITAQAEAILPETIFNIQSTGNAIARVASLDPEYKASVQIFNSSNSPNDGFEIEYSQSTSRVDMSIFSNTSKKTVISIDKTNGNVGLHTVTPEDALTIGLNNSRATLGITEQENNPSTTTDVGKVFVKAKSLNTQSQSLYFMDDEGNVFDLIFNAEEDKRLVYTDTNCNTYAGDTPDSRSDILPEQQHNTALGCKALYDITTGDYNTGAGSHAGQNITTGSHNIAVGYNAGAALITGSNNIFVGEAFTTSTKTDLTNSILIGNGNLGGSPAIDSYTFLLGDTNDNAILRGTLGPNLGDRHLYLNKGTPLSIESSDKLDSLTFKQGQGGGQDTHIIKHDNTGNTYPAGELSFRFQGDGNSNELFTLSHKSAPYDNCEGWKTNADRDKPFAELRGDLFLSGGVHFCDGSQMASSSGIVYVGGVGISSSLNTSTGKTELNLDINSLTASSSVSSLNSYVAISTNGTVEKTNIDTIGTLIDAGRPRIMDCDSGAGQNHVFTNTSTIDSTTCGATFVGYRSGDKAANCDYTNFIGYEAGSHESSTPANAVSSSAYSVFIGERAGWQVNSADHSVFIGHRSGYNADNSRLSVFIGDSAGKDSHSARSVGIGDNALEGVTGSENIEITAGTGGSNRIIGNGVTVSNKLAIGTCIAGDMSAKKVSIGNASLTPDAVLEVKANATADTRLQEWKDETGKVVAYLTRSGDLFIDGSVSSF